MVAEYMRVWRFFAHLLMIRRTSSMKPMSSIRSTSSRMRISILSSLRVFSEAEAVRV